MTKKSESGNEYEIYNIQLFLRALMILLTKR